MPGDSPPREGQGDVAGGRRCALEPAGTQPGVPGKRGANDWQGMKELTSPTMPASNCNRPALPALQDISDQDAHRNRGPEMRPIKKTKNRGPPADLDPLASSHAAGAEFHGPLKIPSK